MLPLQAFSHPFPAPPCRREGVLEARAIVFEGPEDYHGRINDPELAVDEDRAPFLRHRLSSSPQWSGRLT